MVRLRVPLPTLAWVVGGLTAGGLWWWAVLRLVLAPEQSGPVEATIAAGGWGLSLLPVHVAASPAKNDRSGVISSPRRRWGGGSDPS